VTSVASRFKTAGKRGLLLVATTVVAFSFAGTAAAGNSKGSAKPVNSAKNSPGFGFWDGP